jgi:hypothetical protein
MPGSTRHPCHWSGALCVGRHGLRLKAAMTSKNRAEVGAREATTESGSRYPAGPILCSAGALLARPMA